MDFSGAACAPETLKIHVPPTGVDSVNQEDLRRAYWALERGDDPDNGGCIERRSFI